MAGDKCFSGGCPDCSALQRAFPQRHGGRALRRDGERPRRTRDGPLPAPARAPIDLDRASPLCQIDSRLGCEVGHETLTGHGPPARRPPGSRSAVALRPERRIRGGVRSTNARDARDFARPRRRSESAVVCGHGDPERHARSGLLRRNGTLLREHPQHEPRRVRPGRPGFAAPRRRRRADAEAVLEFAIHYVGHVQPLPLQLRAGHERRRVRVPDLRTPVLPAARSAVLGSRFRRIARCTGAVARVRRHRERRGDDRVEPAQHGGGIHEREDRAAWDCAPRAASARARGDRRSRAMGCEPESAASGAPTRASIA